jgi:multiple antibiotic resistance protein
VLVAAPMLERALGHRGIVAIERLMGLVLTAIAVQMLLNGVREFAASIT